MEASNSRLEISKHSPVKRWKENVSAERENVSKLSGVGKHDSLGRLKKVPRWDTL